MTHYDYIIVGGGMTAGAAAAGIRRRDKSGSVAIFSSESYPIYNRPPLSKKLWTEERVEDVWFAPDVAASHAELHLTTEITRLNPHEKIITDKNNHAYHYGKLLLATGGHPVTLPFDDVPIIYFRDLSDYFKLRQESQRSDRFLVIGGGFIGSEVACALNVNQKHVTIVYPEPHLVDRLFPSDLKVYIDSFYRDKGVTLLPNNTIKDLTADSDGIAVTTSNHTTFHVDGVIAGIGIKPAIELAEDAHLKVEDGIAVNTYLQTSDPDIYAAGDVASFPYPYPSQKSRVEHEDNALTQGRAAGENMAGAGKPYHHLPFFYSDMFSMGYEAIGQLDPALDIYTDWVKPYEEGVLYYLQNKKVVGVLNWNVWDGIPAARQLITDQQSYDNPESMLKGKIRNG